MPGLYSHTTRATGTVLTASIYNADHQNHIDNQTMQMTDDYSANVSQMQATTSPGGVGTESLATSLAGEIERLRHVIKTMHNGAQWYDVAAGGFINSGLIDAKGDLIVGTADNTVARLAVGSNTKKLQADSSQASGMGWVTSLGLISDTCYGISSHTVTITIASPGAVSLAGQKVTLFPGMPVVFTTTGALPTGITAGTTYYVSQINAPAMTFNISATPGGAHIITSGSQSGTHTAASPVYNKSTNNPSYVEIEMWGAGGAGGNVGATAGAVGSGGAGGEYRRFFGPASSIISGNVTLNVGVGGVMGTPSTITSAAIFTGPTTMDAGSGGTGQTGGASTPLTGGAPVSGTDVVGIAGTFFKQSGSYGGASISTASAATSYSGAGGASGQGGGVPGGSAGATFGGRHGYSVGTSNYTANPGVGGSGAAGATAGDGGNGSAGLIRIREYA